MSTFHVDPKYQPLMREIGLDADAVFSHPLIKPWRTLDDRENCTLDYITENGETIRWHIKRYPAHNAAAATAEVEGVNLLNAAAIPTMTLVGWGRDATGRSFTITEDLSGYADTEKLIAGGMAFATIAEASATLTAKLHAAELHHRDLYLCHFFTKLAGATPELRIIDVARVKKLPKFFRHRWIVKDLAQFWYSATQLAIDESQRRQWLESYARNRRIPSIDSLQRAVIKKANWIARHDAKLRAKEPTRNISLQKG